MVRTLEEVRQKARALDRPVSIAVAAAGEEAVIEAVVEAKKEGLAQCLLVGDSEKIQSLLEKMGCGKDSFPIIPAASPEEAAQKAVRLVHQGEASALLKGFLPTPVLMRAVLDKENGLRDKSLMSHCMLYQSPALPRLINDTDGGMCTFPTLEQKEGILENAIHLMHCLEYDHVYAALLSAGEQVDPKNRHMVDAQILADKKEHWASLGATVFGPVGLDLAISEEACETKGYHCPGAGQADIILVPDYQVGNCLGKCMSYFGKAQNGGLVLGAKAPIMLVSRADPSLSKLNSMALAALVASKK